MSTYGDQQAALGKLAENASKYSLVVTDFNMPGMSGIDVARAVRAIRADLPVVIASGFIDETLRQAAADAGVRELLLKADGVEDFCDVVARLVLSA